jgi:hypothetical protein
MMIGVRSKIIDLAPLAAKGLGMVGIICLFKKGNKNDQSVLLLVYHAICGQKNQYKFHLVTRA